MIKPPVGLNLFVTSGVAKMPMMQVVRAALPFLAVLFVFLIPITYVPWISTFLPNMVMGPEIILNEPPRAGPFLRHPSAGLILCEPSLAPGRAHKVPALRLILPPSRPDGRTYPANI